MSLLRAFATTETARVLRGGEGASAVHLRAPQPHDFIDWAALREESRAFLQPWEPQWAEDELTRSAYRRRLRRYAREIRDGRAYPFFLFREEDGALVGGATLSNIRRGVAQACSLGYWMGAAHAGKGYMSEAVRVLLAFAFGELALHRVEAACLPHNAASQRLLEKAGFSREGYARHYLRIAGKWQDHLLFARLSSDVATGDTLADIQPRHSPVWRVQAGVLAGEKEIL